MDHILPRVIWFTGLSGAGKSTLARALACKFLQRGQRSILLDGDALRDGLCNDLAFSPKDRRENLRRAAEMARLVVAQGIPCVAAFISPAQEDRQMIRRIVGTHRFSEIYVKCDLAVCEARDVKGLYRRARAHEIANFTGISSPYEPPEAPDLIVNTNDSTIEECLTLIERHLGTYAGPHCDQAMSQ